jgi:beta-lactamase class D
MNRQFIFIVLLSLLAVTGACQKPELDIFAPIFEAHDSSPETSTLVIKRLSDNKVWISNLERVETRFIPASTSKIPHTLIALETKQVLPETLFKWDGQKRTFTSWNQDQTLTQAYRHSVVWVYQEITQSLGRDIMASWLKGFNYGNHDIGTCGNVTRYWLDGPLKISALEQVNFLTKLSKREFPLSPETYEKSWAIFKNETNGSHILYAKTGWMYDENAMDIGWFVGWVETHNPSETYVFALNMDMPKQDDRKKRKPIVMNALQTIGAWPE